MTNAPRVHGDLGFVKKGRVDGSEELALLGGASFRLSGVSDYGNHIDLHATSDARGAVRFADVEKGRYTLEEVVSARGYILANRTFTVVCDETGRVTLSIDAAEPNVEFIQANAEGSSGEAAYIEKENIVIDEPLHSFGLLKVDALDGVALSGAGFRLTGTSDYGMQVDVTQTSLASGAVDFTGLEPGTYSLREVVAPTRAFEDAQGEAYTVHYDIDETMNAVMMSTPH